MAAQMIGSCVRNRGDEDDSPDFDNPLARHPMYPHQGRTACSCTCTTPSRFAQRNCAPGTSRNVEQEARQEAQGDDSVLLGAWLRTNGGLGLLDLASYVFIETKYGKTADS